MLTPEFKAMMDGCLELLPGGLWQKFDRFLEWVAFTTKIERGLPVKLPQQAWEELPHCCDITLLAQGDDQLGEYARSIEALPAQPAGACGSRLTPAGGLLYQEPCGTGSDLLAAFKEYGNKVVYLGAEPDKRAYQVAVIQLLLAHAPAKILYTGAGRDPSFGSPDWTYANRFVVPRVRRKKKEE